MRSIIIGASEVLDQLVNSLCPCVSLAFRTRSFAPHDQKFLLVAPRVYHKVARDEVNTAGAENHLEPGKVSVSGLEILG